MTEPYRLPGNDDELMAECEMEMFRSSGPGGQNVNRRETAVRLRHVPTGIVVSSQEERSQHRNRQICLEKLRRAIERRNKRRRPRIRTRVPQKAKERRLKEKAERKEIKRMRRKPDSLD